MGSLAPGYRSLLWGIFALLLLGGGCSLEPEPDLAILETKVRNILTLHTYEMVYKDVAWVGESERLFGLLTTLDKRLLFSLKIRVRAGIDASKGLTLQILDGPAPSGSLRHPTRSERAKLGQDTALRRVLVTLPPGEILLVDADETSLREYFSLEYGGRITQNDWETQIAKARDRVRQDALGRGITAKATENAQALLATTLIVAGFDEVWFVAPSAPAPTAPAEEASNG